MSAVKTGFMRAAKKSIFILLSALALTISFSQMASAGSPVDLNVSGSATYVVSGEQALVAPGLTLTGDAIDSVRVAISANFTSGDYLGIQGATGTSGDLSGISWSYNPSTGVMNLQNAATTAAYQSVLRQITYYSTAGILPSTTRTISFSIGNALYCPATGHFYKYISSPEITWDSAITAAAGLNYYGLQGYLVTVTSQAENDFIQSELEGRGWLGASDSVIKSEWYWVTGPESGTYFFKQTGAAYNSVDLYSVYGGTRSQAGYIDGHAINGLYNNWRAADGEPNDWDSGEYYAHIYPDGTWNDYPIYSDAIHGYVVEYGGMPGDPILQLTGDVTINVEMSADLSITQSGSSGLAVTGSQLQYTLSLTNNGPSLAESVSLIETYPAGFEFSSAVPLPDTGTDNQWTFGSLDDADTRIITITGLVKARTGFLTNLAAVTSSTDDPLPANNSVSNNIPVAYPQSVGGEVVQVNKPALLVPALVIGAVIMFGGTILVLSRRKRS